MKRSVLIFSIILLSLSFASAYYGSYNNFSLSDLLDQIDSPTMILGAIFIIAFILINYALSRVFKDKNGEPDTKIAGVLALVLSLFLTWGINKSGYDFENIFYSIGFSEDFLYLFLILALIGFFIFLVVKLKSLGKTLLLAGFTLIAISFFVYSGLLALILGILSIIVGSLILNNQNTKPK
ncbi:MAG: hypothetical protein ABH811_01280 [archaeon]